MHMAAECETMPCSLHICGQYSRDILQGNWCIFDEIELPWDIFQRFQLNIAPYFNKIGNSTVNFQAFLE